MLLGFCTYCNGGLFGYETDVTTAVPGSKANLEVGRLLFESVFWSLQLGETYRVVFTDLTIVIMPNYPCGRYDLFDM